MSETFTKKSYQAKDLAGEILEEVTFETCSFIATDLTGTRVNEVVFEGCKLVGVDFRKCKGFLDMKFYNCVMDGCNFSDLVLKDQMFVSCELRRCTLLRTDLTGADFSHTDLTETLIHECTLVRTDFSRAKNYAIDPRGNKLGKTKFSLPEAVSLLRGFDIELKTPTTYEAIG